MRREECDANHAGVTGRTLFIGDVHGCADELEQLLDATQWSSSDRVFFVGDLVARGPDTPRVLELYRRVSARGVMGNHEDRILEARAERNAGRPGPRLSPAHEWVLAQLSEDDWALLEGLPLWLDVPEHEVRVVHAGVVPGVPITEQKRRDLLKMRALERDGTATSSWRKRSWAADYPGPPHIVFGHNAISGLQLHDAATGLDSGCVYGGALSALVLPARAPVPPPGERTRHIASVPARRRYVDYGPRVASPEKGTG